MSYEVGQVVDVIRKGRVLYSGTVVGWLLDEDDGYGKDYEKLRLEISDLGVRVFERTVSFRGVASEWRAKARDMRRLGHVELRPRPS